jgi:catechol 2,3-dioxygenase-like lactoylglutathione lyase family enzyme
MNLFKLCPILYTRDVRETVLFYGETCGFHLLSEISDDGDLTWARMRRDHVDLMISLPNDHIPFDVPTFTGSFYIESENVDALWSELKDKVSICYSIQNFDYGMREFAIYDNNGYIIQFGQEIDLTAQN